MGNSDDDVCGFLPKIDDKSPQGFLGRLKLSELRPTQNGVGMDEVKAKVKGLQDKSGGKLLDYLLPRTVPIVIGNDGYYLIDHHHLGIPSSTKIRLSDCLCAIHRFRIGTTGV